MEYIQKELPAMKFVGIKINTSTQACSSECPIVWNDFMSKYQEIKNPINPNKMYGVSFVTSKADCTFKYVAALEVNSLDGQGEGFEKVEVPASNYLIFTHKGGLETLGATYGQIMEEVEKIGKTQQNFWIELYDERYISNSNESEFDILIPVE